LRPRARRGSSHARSGPEDQKKRGLRGTSRAKTSAESTVSVFGFVLASQFFCRFVRVLVSGSGLLGRQNRRTQNRRTTVGKRLFVGNLSYQTTEADLRDLFGQSGTVAEAKVVMDRDTGRPRGFAFVEMSTDAEAQEAMSQLDGREFGGRTLKVNEAQERSGGGGGGGRGGGFGGGGGGGGGGRGGGRGRW
jgi:RNA recognition motif-containing protein